ncbi:methyl-accepting chemotaxis protein [Egbenema bharatensis]|uniref:methyl-accepting chemotaxis protein n=1 Tax=Egbenema bharatensis TaxID=3463334 RepID=UPI003A84F390
MTGIFINSRMQQDDTTKVPKEIIWVVVAICIIPFVLNLLGIDFGTPGQPLDVSQVEFFSPNELADAMHHALAGSFIHSLLEWSAFCAAIFIVLLSFLNYSIKGNPTVPIIGCSLFFAGVMDAFHTLAADRLIEAVADTQNLIPFTWAICRLFNALIVVVGMGIVLFQKRFAIQTDRKQNLRLVLFVSVMLGFIAYGIIQFCATRNTLPTTMFPDSIITRPWDVAPLIIFLLAGIFLYPYFYRHDPNLFSHALIISIIPNVATQTYMALGSTALFDNGFNVAHFLKILAYLVPLIGLSLEYVQIYRKESRSLSRDLRQSLSLLNSLAKQVLDSTTLTTLITTSGQRLETMMAEQVASTNDVMATAQEISEISAKLATTVQQMDTAFEELQQATGSLTKKLGAIAEKADGIDDIVLTITEISNQTKLLSLNASIQAADNEEGGQGFEIVAQEIVKLATETATVTRKIQPIVREMQTAVSSGVREMNNFTSEHVEAIAPHLQMVHQGMKAQLEGAQTISSAIAQLSTSSAQTANYLKHTLDDTNSALEQLNRAVQQLQQEVAVLER